MKNALMVELRGNRTQKEVAKAIGIPISTYAMIECGHRFPRRTLAIKVAEHFQVTVEGLFFTLNGHESRPNKVTV